MKRRNRTYLVLVCALCLTLLAGCDGTGGTASSTPQGAQSAASAAPPTAPPSESPASSPTPELTPEPTSEPTPEPTIVPTPKPTAAPQAAEPVLISEFSTKIVDSEPSRLENLKLACKMINGTVLGPGEVFSFNGTVGERTASRGFQMGHVFEGKKKTEAIGGGICQVSSTLYNAARNADLEIVERHQHKRKVDYVKLGDDATVSYGELDFKFRNNNDCNLKISAYLTSSRVVAQIWRP